MRRGRKVSQLDELQGRKSIRTSGKDVQDRRRVRSDELVKDDIAVVVQESHPPYAHPTSRVLPGPNSSAGQPPITCHVTHTCGALRLTNISQSIPTTSNPASPPPIPPRPLLSTISFRTCSVVLKAEREWRSAMAVSLNTCEREVVQPGEFQGCWQQVASWVRTPAKGLEGERTGSVSI